MGFYGTMGNPDILMRAINLFMLYRNRMNGVGFTIHYWEVKFKRIYRIFYWNVYISTYYMLLMWPSRSKLSSNCMHLN
jgi:hypothetical protein